MLAPLSRRVFLTFTGGALFAPSFILGSDGVPSVLDHILLGCNQLESGVDFVEQHTGVRAAFGGVHPGRGTQNALLSLGDRHYLEIIAPDPAQSAVTNPLARFLHSLSEPKLVGWAAHPGELAAFAKKLGEAGVGFTGPTPGSRKRPDGRVLQWQTLSLKDDYSRLLPFFIEWSPDSPHPASDAPSGCRLVRFAIVTPNPDSLKTTLAVLSLDVTITKGVSPQICATLSGPRGQLDIRS
jgi:hypothetical protein